MNTTFRHLRPWRQLGAAVLLGSALGASANVLVTFQVDMSNAAFDPNTQTVAARGSFNGWSGPFALTNNPNGANPSLWSGTTNLPSGNGSVVAYKYTIEQPPNTTYENVAEGGGHNRLITLPTANCASITAPLVYFGDVPITPATLDVTFQVDMAQQINTGAFNPASSSVYTRGYLMGWSPGGLMTNDPSILRTNQFGLVTSNVYTFTYTATGSPGQTTDFKFFIDTGNNWDSPAVNTGDPADNNNRFFNQGTGATQKLPIVFFSDAPYAPVATNNTTFQVDMTAQIQNGNFTPSGGSVELRGNFNGWGTPQVLCTNDPSAANTNIYKVTIPLVDGVGAQEFYKFWMNNTAVNGGWETMADNRLMKIVAGNTQVLPVVFFSNVDPGDLLPSNTVVTFSVNMTNAVGTDSHVFDPANDGVFINGIPTFAAWTPSLPQLTNNPVGSGIYSIDILLPAGSPVQQTYKYSINGNDDEAGTGNNHVRYVRTAATGAYAMQLDKFGIQLVEPSFGQLSVGAASGGHVPISWLGRPGVNLQSNTNLSSGGWRDLANTDGGVWSSGVASTLGLVSVTNYPATDAKFFRLIKR